MTIRRIPFILALLAASVCVADVDVENGNAESFTLSAYLKVRFGQFGGSLEVPDRSFMVESAGLSADFRVTGNTEGQLQLETRPEDIYVKDCFIEWQPLNELGLTLGRFKKPFCLNTMLSRWDLQSIDHFAGDGELEDLLYSGRDIGAMIVVSPGIDPLPEISLGVFNGSPDFENQDNEVQYAVRALFRLPMDIELGAGLTSLRFGETDLSSVEGYVVSSRQMAYGADLQFSRDLSGDFSMMMRGEYIRGDNWDLANVMAGDPAPDFQTWWCTAGITWLTWRPSIRSITASVSYGSWKPDRNEASREDELTVTLELDTGSPFTVSAAAVSHRPSEMLFEEERMDYLLEAAVDL
ncbi:MAG: hypothetical protein AVO35_01210 [Candidatus Aegiribacteria sp. MLS_C]|nr:MAG: hypothetical protein AVO35_01210 [Candidatus Aegiribacteria sp. MLS_C]